jgi:hypothetical protein
MGSKSRNGGSQFSKSSFNSKFSLIYLLSFSKTFIAKKSPQIESESESPFSADDKLPIIKKKEFSFDFSQLKKPRKVSSVLRELTMKDLHSKNISFSNALKPLK